MDVPNPNQMDVLAKYPQHSGRLLGVIQALGFLAFAVGPAIGGAIAPSPSPSSHPHPHLTLSLTITLPLTRTLTLSQAKVRSRSVAGRRCPSTC